MAGQIYVAADRQCLSRGNGPLLVGTSIDRCADRRRLIGSDRLATAREGQGVAAADRIAIGVLKCDRCGANSRVDGYCSNTTLEHRLVIVGIVPFDIRL